MPQVYCSERDTSLRPLSARTGRTRVTHRAGRRRDDCLKFRSGQTNATFASRDRGSGYGTHHQEFNDSDDAASARTNALNMNIAIVIVTTARVISWTTRLTQQAEHGIAEAGRIPAKDLHIGAFQQRQFAQRFLAAQSVRRALAERKLPDKWHILNNRAAPGWMETRCRQCYLSRCNSQQRDNAVSWSADGDGTLFRNVAELWTCNRIHRQRYAATAHPTEVEAAKESAANLDFECDAEACSLGHGG